MARWTQRRTAARTWRPCRRRPRRSRRRRVCALRHGPDPRAAGDLFPFLTGRLPFLDGLRARARRIGGAGTFRLGAGGRRRRDLPPLLLTSAGPRRARGRCVVAPGPLAHLPAHRGVDRRYDPRRRPPARRRARARRAQSAAAVSSSRPTPDPRFWVMLGLAADHLDVIEFVGRLRAGAPVEPDHDRTPVPARRAGRGQPRRIRAAAAHRRRHSGATARLEPAGRRSWPAAAARLRALDARATPRPARTRSTRHYDGVRLVDSLDHRRDQPERLRRGRRAVPGWAAALGPLGHRRRRPSVARHGRRRAHDLRRRCAREIRRALRPDGSVDAVAHRARARRRAQPLAAANRRSASPASATRRSTF